MKNKILLLICTCMMLWSCQTGHRIYASSQGRELFKVTIFYPNGEGKTFDMKYYEDQHMPMVASFIGKNLEFYEIDQGLSGRTANDPTPFLAIGYFYIKNIKDYNNAIAQNRDAIVNDFKNYTNIQPVIQISEVKQVRK